MPPLPDLMPPYKHSPSPSLVPVIHAKRDKGKAPVRHPPRRQYDDGPLPFRPNATAPKSAKIVDRVQEHDGGLVGYKLKIGDVEVNNVGADEILDYVSALDLEQFEMQKFREEAQIWKALEDEQESRRRARLKLAAEKARMRGAVMVEGSDDSDGLGAFAKSAEPVDEGQIGKHGRARPDYSKFYVPPGGHRGGKGKDFGVTEVQPRRRRRRDPVTGELMPLDPDPRSTSPPQHSARNSIRSKSPPQQLEETKRRRRKRHPLTGELMPLGWKYDPEAEKDAYEMRRSGLGDPSFKRLSISGEPQAKRQRFDTDSMSPVPTKAEIMGKAASQSTPKRAAPPPIDLMSSDSEDEVKQVTGTPKPLKSPPKPANTMMRGTIDLGTDTSDEESESENATTSMMRPSASQHTPKTLQTTTSILSPSAARASSTDTPPANVDDESDEEWVIESIQGHRMSDPKSHPPELGKQSVMLYKVKWEGYNSTTWEPVDSFGDRSVVDEYRAQAGLKPLPKEEESDEDEVVVASDRSASKKRSGSKDVSSDEEVYEFEKIVAHHLSDPRTHPKELGKTSVMLYKVKWKGTEETSWEPAASFDDNPKPLAAYKKKHGLR